MIRENDYLGRISIRSVRALVALLALLTLGMAGDASALSFNAFLTRSTQSSPAIGAAQLGYNASTGMLRIDTTALGVTPSRTSDTPYSLRVGDMLVLLGSSNDWLALANARGMGSHLEVNPCAGSIYWDVCQTSFKEGLMKGGAVLTLKTAQEGGSLSGVLRLAEVPEPGTGTLAAIGLAGLAAFGRKRR